MLHGTSSFIFVLLGIDSASEQRKLRGQDQGLERASQLPPDEEYDEEFDEELSPSETRRRFDRRQPVTEVDLHDLFEKRWKPLRTLKQPRRGRKGLIGQTIHEESSGSDLF